MAIAAIFVAACASGLTGTQFPRRRILASAAAALTSTSTFSANAASGPAVDLLTTVSSLSLQARQLQYFVREDVPVRVKAQRVRARRKDLDELLGAMSVAAPDLRLCRVADCECTPDAMLMDSAAEQVTAVRSHLAALDKALVGPKPFERLSLKGGALNYPGGAVEQELEEICEASDAFLDLAAGRPLMTARLAPLSSGVAPIAASTSAKPRSPQPRLCSASASSPPSSRVLPGEYELNLIYDSKCAVCQWEVDFLSQRDAEGRLMYTDLESDDFEEGVPRNGNLDYETALASFHAVRADGELLKGMPVFQAAYAAVGLGWVWRIYDLPIAAKILDWGYNLFARFRTDITRGSSLEALVEAHRRRQRVIADGCDACFEQQAP